MYFLFICQIKFYHTIPYHTTVSSSFHVVIGVKQGVGLLYLQHYSMYIWAILAFLLITSVLVVILAKKTINHVCYADDICLIVLPSSAMLRLLNICMSYSVNVSTNSQKVLVVAETLSCLSPIILFCHP